MNVVGSEELITKYIPQENVRII